MYARNLAGLLAVVGLAACAPSAGLAPAPGAMPAPDGGVMAGSAGVRLDARPNAWRGIPANLTQQLTPLLVTITNDGTGPVRIRYSDFMLDAAAGKSYRALPPFNIHETVEAPLPEPGFTRFAVAPYLSGWYPRMRVYADPFRFDDVYFNRYYPMFVQLQLPTGDMIAKALPEGVLEPGGRMTGFLYFERIDDHAGQMRLTQLLTAPSGQDLGRVEIPFQVRAG